MKVLEFTTGYLFCGSGLGALGTDAATMEVQGHEVRFRNLGGMDFDAEACQDFERLTGAPALCVDIARLRPWALRSFFGTQAPHLFKWSPPCKGASGLLSTAMSLTKKYQDMNRLALKALRKVLAAWRKLEERPWVIIIENVPSFRTRCAKVLKEMQRLLGRAGYLVDMRTHDLGEEGGLAQQRKRFTLVARHPRLCPVAVELPPPRRLRGVGEVLGPLPWPDDPKAGRMHRLPRVSWLNAVRLSLIPPGGDWRDLPKRGEVVSWLEQRGLWPTGVDTAKFRRLVEEELANPAAAEQKRREVHRRHPVQAWAEPAPTVSGPGGAGLAAVEDRRLLETVAMRSEQRPGAAGVMEWGKPAGTIIDTPYVSGGSSAVSVADPRLFEALAMGADNPGRHTAKYAVGTWEEAARTVTGAQTVGSGGPAIADARLFDGLALGHAPRPGAAGVTGWTEAAPTVRGVAKHQNGGATVADARPLEALGLGRTGEASGSFKGRPGLFGVGDWQAPSPTVVGHASVSGGNAQASVADPRALEQLGLGCSVRNGFYGVLDWQHPARTITGSLQLDCGPGAVADPRPPPRLVIDVRLALQLLAEGWEVPTKALMPAIISPLSGCWHRPLTTLELAVLQGLPPVLEEEGTEGLKAVPLVLAGSSDKRWRERIGNGIPVGGAESWGRSIGKAMALSALGAVWSRSGGLRWVQPEQMAVH